MKIKDIYHFQVIDEIQAGNKVYFLDEPCPGGGARVLNRLPLGEGLAVIEAASKDDCNGYIFWEIVND